jgi:hypothetical protein
MAAPLFGHLTDEQLRALCRILDAALTADPSLASGDGLVVATEAWVERRHRQTIPVRLLDEPAAATIPPDALPGALDQAAATIRPKATSTTKWSPIARLLARALALSQHDVYVTSVGGLSRNIAVRLTQSRRAREATVAVIIWTPGGEPTGQAIAAASRACHESPRPTLIFSHDTNRLDLAALILPPSLPAPAALTIAYPAASVVVAGAAPTSDADD